MLPRERVLKAFNHKEPDRVPFMYRDVPEVRERLKKDLGVATNDELFEKLDIDFRWVAPEYTGPELKLNNGHVMDIWGVEWKYTKFSDGAGYWNEVIHPLAEAQTSEDLEKYSWPRLEWYDFSKLESEGDRY